MEDLSVIIKKTFFESMYKKKTETFGTINERVEKMNHQRKNLRRDVIFEKRNIPVNMSPFLSPVIKQDKVEKTEVNLKKNENINKRLEMLAKWKVEKEKKKLEQKKNMKPLFKVSHVATNLGLPNLETVNKEIKGKPFKSKFAPPNHKFKPPPNIQPIHFQQNKEETTISVTPSRRVTRSQTRGLIKNVKQTPMETPVPDMKKTTKPPVLRSNELKNQTTVEKKVFSKSRKPSTPNDNKTSKGKNNKSTPKYNKKNDKQAEEKTTPKGKRLLIVEESEDRAAKAEENEINTPNPLIVLNTGEIESKTDEREEWNVRNELKTPEQTEAPVYVSPFVTVTRGKNSARKEFEARKSGKSFASQTIADHSSKKAGAAYFTWRLDNQIDRLQGLCDHWNKYKEQEESSPEEAVSMIDVAIGQTNLLITKKFVQFRGLIDRCRNEDSETPVTCEDLHGFWDMMYIQINNLDKRFENLERMKSNNWQEIVPEVKKEPAKRKGRPPKVVKASAGLMEAIKAARRKKQDENTENLESKKERKTPQNRVSGRFDYIKTSGVKHRDSSPGLMMMKVAQYAKGVETPMKSILKSDAQKSVKSQRKVVLFQDEKTQNVTNIENDLNLSNSQTKGKTPPRRSRRLSKTKLF